MVIVEEEETLMGLPIYESEEDSSLAQESVGGPVIPPTPQPQEKDWLDTSAFDYTLFSGVVKFSELKKIAAQRCQRPTIANVDGTWMALDCKSRGCKPCMARKFLEEILPSIDQAGKSGHHLYVGYISSKDRKMTNDLLRRAGHIHFSLPLGDKYLLVTDAPETYTKKLKPLSPHKIKRLLLHQANDYLTKGVDQRLSWSSNWPKLHKSDAEKPIHVIFKVSAKAEEVAADLADSEVKLQYDMRQWSAMPADKKANDNRRIASPQEQFDIMEARGRRPVWIVPPEVAEARRAERRGGAIALDFKLLIEALQGGGSAAPLPA